MNGIKNFLELINQNWTTILTAFTLVASICVKIRNYLIKSNDEKVNIAKKQIEETILGFISEAEVNWDNWSKTGSIKRSKVIEQIYAEYPILSRVSDQEEMINWIDNMIKESLKTLREIVKEQTTTTEK